MWQALSPVKSSNDFEKIQQIITPGLTSLHPA